MKEINKKNKTKSCLMLFGRRNKYCKCATMWKITSVGG